MTAVPQFCLRRTFAGALLPICMVATAAAQTSDIDLVETVTDCGELCVWQARLGDGIPRESYAPPGSTAGYSALSVPRSDGSVLVVAERVTEAGRNLWTVLLSSDGGQVGQNALTGKVCAAAPRGDGAVVGLEDDNDAAFVALIDATGNEVMRAPFGARPLAVAAGTDGQVYVAGSVDDGPLVTAYATDGTVAWSWTGADGPQAAEAVGLAALLAGGVRAVVRAQDPNADQPQNMRRWLVDVDTAGAVTNVVEIGLDVHAFLSRFCSPQKLTTIIPTDDDGNLVAVYGHPNGWDVGLSLSLRDADGNVMWDRTYPSTFWRNRDEMAASFEAETQENQEERAWLSSHRADHVIMDAAGRIWISGYRVGPGIGGANVVQLLDSSGADAWRYEWEIFDGEEKIDHVYGNSVAATQDGDVLVSGTAGMPDINERAVISLIDVADDL